MAKSVSRAAISILILLGSGVVFWQTAPRQCGYDRWPLKVLADKDLPYPYDRRIGPEEFKTFRVKAVLIKTKRERDSDIHLLIADAENANERMIAEIPAPKCAAGTGHESQYRSGPSCPEAKA